MTVIPVVFSALGTVSKCLEEKLEQLKIRGRIDTIQTTALLKQTRILRRILEKRLGKLEIKGRIDTIQTKTL